MQIQRHDGTLTLDDDARPSLDDMNDIISSFTTEANFQALCDASVKFPSETNEEFATACKAWIAQNKIIQIEDLNSGAIRNQAKQDGITEVTLLAEGGEGDRKVSIYQFGDVRVADTNGDPVWEESVSGDDWNALLEEAGIEL